MKTPTITICCVCKKHKIKKYDGSFVWLAKDEMIAPGYKAAMDIARISHGYCKPCMASEMADQGVEL